MPIRLILFDLDGTLVDSIGDITAAANHALVPLGIDPVDVSEVRTMVGEGPARLMENALRAQGLDRDVDPLVKIMVDYYRSHLTVHSRPYPGVMEVLAGLGGYRRAVVSNKPEVLTHGVLRDLGLADHLDMALGSDALPERKPSPGPILHLMELFSAIPKETVIVGDSPIDVAAGRAAGIWTVAVTYGYGKAGFERDAHFVIHRMEDLAGVLGSIG